MQLQRADGALGSCWNYPGNSSPPISQPSDGFYWPPSLQKPCVLLGLKLPSVSGETPLLTGDVCTQSFG